MRRRMRAGGVAFLLMFWAGFSVRGDQQSGLSGATPERARARDLLREFVEINTTPANGSTRAAEAAAVQLRSAGFPAADVFVGGPRPEKHNLVARLRGRTPAKPILLIAHLDVVDAPREGWSPGLDPFQLTERDGFLYGRGVLDNKAAVAGLVANLIRLKAEGFVPRRDIIVALTADEESGSSNGITWLLANRRELIDAAFCLNLDAGGGQMENGRRARMTIQTSQKANLSFRAETKSPGGHSSMPIRDNAIYRLSAGLSRLADHDLPFRFNETTRTYFERSAAAESGSIAVDMRAVAKDPPDLDAAKRLAAASPYFNSILRTTCVATRMAAGHADNALPQTASAIINCRLFPGDTLEFVRGALAEILDDPQISLIPMGSGQTGPASQLLPEVMVPVERISAEMWPGIPVLPVMDPWSGDSLQMRRAGFPTLGVSGTFSDDLDNPHGANERLAVNSFYESVEFLCRLIKAMTGDAPMDN
jgi:acetylornithine deacetylase/succinyl-diaminopimelate desuccinylase-like protein